MLSSVSLIGLVAVVTGGGGSLGHAYCVELAKRGASVVVNDLLLDGIPASKSSAQKVVEEIKAMGGNAIANHDSVEFGQKIVEFTLKTFGTIDILVNNAGIIRDVSFAKMTDEEWDSVNLINIRAVYSLTKAAWTIMRKQNFGRIIMISSSAGLYGNFGQANYGAAKMAQVGLGFTLAKEGESRNVLTNIIAPIASSPMLDGVIPQEINAAMKPEYVSPLLAYLVSPDCQVNGELFEAGAGWIARTRWSRSKGVLLPLNHPVTAELIRSKWETIEDFSKFVEFPGLMSAADMITKNLETAKLPFDNVEKFSSTFCGDASSYPLTYETSRKGE